MNRKQVFRALLARGLPPQYVYIDGVRDDGWFVDCYYLLETPEGWQVGHQERNIFTPLETFAQESEASADLFARVAKAERWPRPDEPDADPVPWTRRLREGMAEAADRQAASVWDELAEKAAGTTLRTAIEPLFALDGVPGTSDLLRPADKDLTGPMYVVIERIVVDASIDPEGHILMRLADGGVNGVVIDDLLRSGALRRVTVVDDETEE